jgi:hypothetical protein
MARQLSPKEEYNSRWNEAGIAAIFTALALVVSLHANGQSKQMAAIDKILDVPTATAADKAAIKHSLQSARDFSCDAFRTELQKPCEAARTEYKKNTLSYL